MTFKARELSVLAYANGFTLWHYAGEDPLAEMTGASGYFDAASDMLRAGDLIAAVVRGDTAPEAGLLLVTRSDDGGVTVTGVPAPGPQPAVTASSVPLPVRPGRRV